MSESALAISPGYVCWPLAGMQLLNILFLSHGTE
jgi:hypothetical protein